MTQQNSLPASVLNVSITTKMLIGAGIGLLLISLFLLGVKNPDPSWGAYWMARPIVVVSFAGAMGGLFYAVATYLRMLYGWNAVLINLICLLVFIIGLWLGSVLGLNGTLWN